MQRYRITVPTSPMIKKFATAHYGQPCPINAPSSLLAIAVFTLLQKTNFSTRMPLADKNIVFRKYTDTLVFTAPADYFYRYGHSVSADAAIQINRLLESEFGHMLFLFVERNSAQGKRYKGYNLAIEEFAKLYDIDIDTDITFDGLKQIHYRHRKKHIKIMAGLSPQNQQDLTLF